MPRQTLLRALQHMLPSCKVLSAQWHSETACLFTGDETGRLRCWSLQRVLEALGVDPLREIAVGYADSYRGGNRTQGGMGASRKDSVEAKNEKVGRQLASTGKHCEVENAE